MDIKIELIVGFHNETHETLDFRLTETDIAEIADNFGSYHVLEMGRHYREYAITPFSILLPSAASKPFPASSQFRPLPGKLRGGAITGNIGECATAWVARTVLFIPARGIVHATRTNKKCPDFVFHIDRSLENQSHLEVSKLAKQRLYRTAKWWPVEAKASDCLSGVKSAEKDGFLQLIHFWWNFAYQAQLSGNAYSAIAEGAGFGMLIGFVYQEEALKNLPRPRQIRLTICFPKSYCACLAVIKKLLAYQTDKDAEVLVDDKSFMDLFCDGDRRV